MKRSRITSPIVLLCLLASLFSCTDNIIDECTEQTETTTVAQQTTNNEELIKLGEKLINPYTVVNMKKAYFNLLNTGSLKQGSTDDIQLTHYYLRFLPIDFLELAILQNDSTLQLFDYPLDYELQEGGTYYHDPNIPTDQITWQYCAVEKDYAFPEIEYEILEELFLLEQTNEHKSINLNANLKEKLEIEALKITGNIPNTGTHKGGIIRRDWKPSGRITVYDADLGNTRVRTLSHYEYYDCITGEDIDEGRGSGRSGPTLNDGEKGDTGDDQTICQRAIYYTNTVDGGQIPLEGCLVRAYSWFTTHTAITQPDGTFFINHNFRGDVNYSIKWERDDFDIRSGNYGQAYYNGPKIAESPWNLDISKGNDSWLYATVHRAAFTYYYKYNTWGIKKPPRQGNGWLGQKLHLGVKNDPSWYNINQSHYFDFNKLWASAQILIYGESSGNLMPAYALFGTTIHELAHAVHWDIAYSTGQHVLDALVDAPFVSESWAEGVEAVITSDTYNFEVGTKQHLITSDMLDGYTCIVWDMIDDVNQFDESGSGYPKDNVEDFTLSQIEDALYDAFSWKEWREKIYANNPNNETRDKLDELFSNFK